MLIGGCNFISDYRARAALGEYQAAAAANDLPAAKKALLELVRAKDDVAEYWEDLGKVQAAMGSYNDAYYAFTRAYELNRSDPSLIKALTELALRSGDLTQAQARAEELEIVSPGDPWVKMVKGWAAYAELHYDEAIAIADELLAASPYDPVATALKARSLSAMQRYGEAIDILNKQIQAQPSDVGSMSLLAKIYEGQNDWTKVAELARRIYVLSPADQQNALLLVEAAFRAGDVDLGRKASSKLLQPEASPAIVAQVLEIWSVYWPSPQRVSDARRLAGATTDTAGRLTYAKYLTQFGDPAGTISIASPMATLPVRAGSAEANAVLASGLSRSGNLSAAKARFDAVLGFDPGNETALRGRAELELRTGNAGAAVVDAQKLVTVLPNMADNRLLLARAFAAAGNKSWMERTLWTAFRDIPGDERILAALQATKKGDPDATKDLNVEFVRQRDNRLNQGLL